MTSAQGEVGQFLTEEVRLLEFGMESTDRGKGIQNTKHLADVIYEWVH